MSFFTNVNLTIDDEKSWNYFDILETLDTKLVTVNHHLIPADFLCKMH